MENLLLEPLKYYNSTAKALHESNAKDYFDELVKKSNVDIEQTKKLLQVIINNFWLLKA